MGRVTTATFIALLRGVNVGGHNRIPMRELRAACADLGWAGIGTYIQSGNVVFRAESAAGEVADALEGMIERRFGLSIPVIVRTARDWTAYVRGNPFPEESHNEPHLVMLGLSKTTPRRDAADRLQERAVNGEQVLRIGDALWIHFERGVARSKLSPALLDRLVGSPVTMRNWRTVLKLRELAASGSGVP